MDVNCFYSIVVPVYNTPIKYLDKCLASLLNQTFKGIEIIIVDDGSSYETAEACNIYAEKDSRIRVIHQKNQGVSAARNTGIYNASGDWVMFVDADDWLELEACERISERLRTQACDILMFNHVRDYEGKQVQMKYGLEPDKLYNTDIISEKELLYKRAMGVPDVSKGWSCIITYIWDKVYSREFLIRTSIIFPVELPKSEDKVFVLSCFEKMRSLLYYEKVLYHYRMNDSSICNRYSCDADKYRYLLVDKLEGIAKRMDAEIGVVQQDSEYNEIMKEFDRYTFGLVSDVLLLKYYHKNNPDNIITRHKEAVHFISTEPFASAIKKVPYSGLSGDAKIKKALLSLKLVWLFCFMKKAINVLKGKAVESD